MSKTIQAIRGMNDILPQQIPYWHMVENVIRELTDSYGYEEIRFPIVEHTELFSRAVGEVTDIVEKEMYTFTDRNEDLLSLRPEGTAGCVRAGIQNGLLYNQIQRLWYMGPMFRHERPQRGRYRQFYQFGVEVFGLSGPDIDAELLFMMARFWKLLGLENQVVLQLNSLGTKETRIAYKAILIEYFEKHKEQLDADCQRRLYTNPLRILDSKNPEMQAMIKGAPKLLEHLDQESKDHFSALCTLLDAAGINYEVNPTLVRGLDYYSITVFEWVTDQLGAQGTVCAGGRYDQLVEQLGGKPTPAIGFALGLERLVELLSAKEEIINQPFVYMVMLGEKAQQYGFLLAEKLRDALPSLKLLVNCGEGSFKSQFKRADKSGAKFAVIIGDDEVLSELISVKYLREDKPQQQMSVAELIKFLK